MTVVGVISGGQLARMMIGPAVELGLDFRVLAEVPGSSAALAATAVGDYRDVQTVREFARGVDVITFDHEHVPSEVIAALIADGVAVHPAAHALQFAQDKLLMREKLGSLGMPMPDWARAENAADVDAFLSAHGGRVVAKTPRGGYDGKGVKVITAADEIAEWLDLGPVLLEELVDFSRELASLVARNANGEVQAWPVVETVQKDGVCAEVILPAPHLSDRVRDVVAQMSIDIANAIDATGVLAIEMFHTTDDRVLINELAMRPHNSGHVTMEGSVTGQFEQHLRAVANMPLGSTESRDEWAVMINVLGGMDVAKYEHTARHPGVKLHNYGKEPRAGRKVGHVTGTGSDLAAVLAETRAVAAIFQ
ncbi:MAG: 5-(carboxyamino)imidazole ribonucleotide synthase [Microbacteriaceae bacterium]